MIMKDGFYIFYRIRQAIDTHWMEHESPEKMRVPYGTLSEAKTAYAKMLKIGECADDSCATNSYGSRYFNSMVYAWNARISFVWVLQKIISRLATLAYARRRWGTVV